MGEVHIVDLDDALISWAMERLGSDYTVEKLDASKVVVEQKAVLYQSTYDWWSHRTEHEELFDNAEDITATWRYTEKLSHEAKATWTLIKALKSSKVLPIKIALEYPVAKDGQQPMSVQFDCSKLSPESKAQFATGLNQFTVDEKVTVPPYSSSKVSAQLQLCQLQDVMFTTDILMSGSIKVHGHKKNKKWTKHELTASIVDALANRKAQGFHEIENPSDSAAPARQVSFRFEGLCSGQAAVATRISTQDIVTSV